MDKRPRSLLWMLARRELLSRRRSSALSLAAIIFAIALALTVALYLAGTQTANDRILGNMQHVVYISVTPEQLDALASDARVEMCEPYKPCDTEFETEGVKFNLVYYESVAESIRTYVVNEGRAPEAYNEICVDRRFMSAFGRDCELGAPLTLDLGARQETFTVTGYTDDGYTSLTHPVRVSREFAVRSPEMGVMPFTALVRLVDADSMPPSTFSTTAYQLALD
ncbi:MAG TPA: hypothetical protein IAB47_01685 [Candidatus Scatomorpha merdigallinarum]|nr:hypothetical protein [Candidatus Scatomorpha merdigallinarum]